MLGGWYSDPGEQQGLKKTASVRVDTALGPEYHVRPTQVNQAPQMVPQQPVVLQAASVQAPQTQQMPQQWELAQTAAPMQYSAPSEQQGLKKTASVRVDTAQQPSALPTSAPSSASRLGRMLEASFRKRPGSIGAGGKADGRGQVGGKADGPGVDGVNLRLSKASFGNKAPPRKGSVTALVPGGTSWRFSMVSCSAPHLNTRCRAATRARDNGTRPCTRQHTPSFPHKHPPFPTTTPL